jgi:uncharacterized membrane protein
MPSLSRQRQPSERATLLQSRWGRVLVALTAALLVGTAAGLAALWPEATRVELPASTRAAETVRAEVTAVRRVTCQAPGQTGCRTAAARITEGADAGEVAEFGADTAGANELVEVGDQVRLLENDVPAGADAAQIPPYSFVEFERRSPLVWMAILFVVVVLALGRWRGVRSLLGLAVSLVLVVKFVVPAILSGEDAVAVAIVGALAVMLATILLAHGVGAKSLSALLGTAVSLGLVVLLSQVFVELANISGFASDQSTLLAVGQDQLSLHGLVIAGMVIAALGVLDDVTVSQASTVMALRAADPTQGLRRLYSSALSVGRDHVAATVNTLVLAYVGASLPTVLLFSLAGTSFGDAANNEAVAQSIVATLAGSIGLIAAVPITTALAALFATRLPQSVVAGSAHAGHHH